MRRHLNPEAEVTDTADNAELQQTFALLLPIRRQRLSRSERQQREQERALRDAEQQIASAEQQLTDYQLTYQQLRAGFAAGVQPQSTLMQGLNAERQACEAVQAQQQQLVQCQRQRQEQQQRLAAAQQETVSRQREMEKLEYLMREAQ